MGIKCIINLLGLINLYSLFTGTSGQKTILVFSSDGENVNLFADDSPTDCASTSWTYSRELNSDSVELFENGMKKSGTERDERLSLGADCSLNIYHATTEDRGVYSFWQYVTKAENLVASVYLHFLQVSPPSTTEAEIRPGSSMTLSCQLYVYDGYPCDHLLTPEGLQLIWVNESGVNLQTDSRFQISSSSSSKHCNISLTTTLLNEDDSTEWRCQISEGSEVKTSVSYTVSFLSKKTKILMYNLFSPTIITSLH
ncbi:uncharacterized protein LOC130240753 [Danio aesculapii]|uniref:uncharacterized protein LOC130240753 n=1 Tax=Danio aesculapii TaxID=1142201 RepID=UPI0024C05E8E|nr:uncharacterized protein LOC130240753 [Danio aesculapii]